MKTLCWTSISTVALALLAADARGSDPVGIYALVDRVVLEPKEDAPERIQVWGAFSLARAGRGSIYEPPARGYLYLRLPAATEKSAEAGGPPAALAEWTDLKKIAGKGQAVGMGSRWKLGKVRVRLAGEKPEAPDEHPMGFGLQRMHRTEDYPPVRGLYTIPAPAAPGHGDEVKPGTITLSTRNIAQAKKDTRYVFEIETASGQKETSPPVEAGEKETRWSPRLDLRAGERCTWKVWAVEGEWKGPAAAARFQVRSA